MQMRGRERMQGSQAGGGGVELGDWRCRGAAGIQCNLTGTHTLLQTHNIKRRLWELTRSYALHSRGPKHSLSPGTAREEDWHLP